MIPAMPTPVAQPHKLSLHSTVDKLIGSSSMACSRAATQQARGGAPMGMASVPAPQALLPVAGQPAVPGVHATGAALRAAQLPCTRKKARSKVGAGGQASQTQMPRANAAAGPDHAPLQARRQRRATLTAHLGHTVAQGAGALGDLEHAVGGSAQGANGHSRASGIHPRAAGPRGQVAGKADGVRWWWQSGMAH